MRNSIFKHSYLLAAAAFLLLIPLRGGLVSTARWQPEDLDDSVRESVNSSAFAAILGEIRASAADFMWVKTEIYMHNGVAFKGHLNRDELTHTGEIDAHEHHEGDDDDCAHSKTVIPEPAGDYRGFVGTLQRQVQPWQDVKAPHVHTSGDELLPWYRMLTYSNPHHWRGYMIGTWWLSKKPATRTQAESFIDEGVRNNPNVFQLQLMRGRVLMQRAAWGEAIGAFRHAAELAEKIRPAAGESQSPAWTKSDEEDYAAALRYIPLIQWRKLGDPAAARQSLAAALERIPGDKALQDLRAQLGPPASKRP